MGNTPKLTDDELLSGIQSLADELGERPTQKQMRLQGPYSINAYKRAFGSWNNALEAAGFAPNTTYQSVTQEELLADLQDLAADLGKSPSQADINEHTGRSHKTYYRKFDGGLKEAKERAGLEHYTQPAQVELVTMDCGNCGRELERQPSEVENNQYSYCDQQCHYEHKQERYEGEGNPQSTLEEVECDVCETAFKRARWERERYDRTYCSNCWGDASVTITCEWCGGTAEVYPALSDTARFCSTECVGEWLSETRTGENHPRFKEKEPPEYYGPNWIKQRQKALRRDQYRCQQCGMTQPESMVEYGFRLSVHHIIPIRQFQTDSGWDYQSANRLANLMTVCKGCHMGVEVSE